MKNFPNKPESSITSVLLLTLYMTLGATADEFGPPPKLTSKSEVPGAAVPARLFVMPENRSDVASFYKSVYLASENVPLGWNGSTANCVAGTNSQAFKDATILRVNYFRAMAGLPSSVELDNSWNDKCQQAALIMSAQGALSHTPDPGWACYTAAGAEAAGKSNLYRGRDGPGAVTGYMDDFGANNYFVGHRRWILYPPQVKMGTGSVPTIAGKLAANSLWVINGSGARPSEPAWVAWPPKGFVPYQVMPRISHRWSFSYPGADFSTTTVTMQREGTNVALTIEPLDNDVGYADNTIVWIPQGVPTSAPTNDITYAVTLSGVRVSGSPQNFAYTVTVIDPDLDPAPPTFTGISLQQTNVHLEWTGTGTLQHAGALNGSWTNVPNAQSPMVVPIVGGAGFFRLQ